MKKITLNAFLKALGYAGYCLLTTFAVAFAIMAVCAFVSMFNGGFVFGLFGTFGACCAAYTCWSVRKDTLV